MQEGFIFRAKQSRGGIGGAGGRCVFVGKRDFQRGLGCASRFFEHRNCPEKREPGVVSDLPSDILKQLKWKNRICQFTVCVECD